MSRDIDAIAEEFLQISSHLRLGIILQLKEKEENLSSLASKLDSTASEMHRNLKRLTDDNIITKNTENLYCLTSYGKMIYSQISCWEFMKNNSGYFKKHDFGNLPDLFLQSIGSLNDSLFVKGFVNVQDTWKKIYSNANKYIDNILFEVSYDSEILSIITSQLKKEVKIISIFLEDAILPESRKKAIYDKSIHDAIREDLLVRRTIKDINTLVVLNEKEAFVVFPNSDGKIDVSEGFYSKNPEFHKWCFAYFNYCLNSSSSFFEDRLKK